MGSLDVRALRTTHLDFFILVEVDPASLALLPRSGTRLRTRAAGAERVVVAFMLCFGWRCLSFIDVLFAYPW